MKFAKVMFLQVSVCPQGGSMCGWVGHAWLWGVCMVAGGCAWLQRGTCMTKVGMHGEGGAW